MLLTAILAFVAGLYLPWWCLVFAAFFVALLIHQRSWRAFLSAFLGVFILWTLLAWWIDMKNDSILSRKVAQLFSLGGSSILLILISAVIGALVAGFAAMSGSYLRSIK